MRCCRLLFSQVYICICIQGRLCLLCVGELSPADDGLDLGPLLDEDEHEKSRCVGDVDEQLLEVSDVADCHPVEETHGHAGQEHDLEVVEVDEEGGLRCVEFPVEVLDEEDAVCDSEDHVDDVAENEAVDGEVQLLDEDPAVDEEDAGEGHHEV